MSSASNRKSSNRGERAVHETFDPELDVEEYSLVNLHQLSRDLQLPARSSYKSKQELYDAITQFLKKQKKEKKKNDVLYVSTGGYDLESMSSKKLRELAIDLDIPERSKPKNHSELKELIEDWFKQGKNKEERISTKKYTKFDPNISFEHYTKKQLYKFGKEMELAVTKGMNLHTLYDALVKGETKKDIKEKLKESKSSNKTKGEKSLDAMLLTELKEEAKKRGVVGYSSKRKAELIEILQALPKKTNKNESNRERFERESRESGKKALRSSGTFTGVFASKPLPEYNFMLDEAFAALAISSPKATRSKVATPPSQVHQEKTINAPSISKVTKTTSTLSYSTADKKHYI
jgi:RNAse (barnase) inhibitor barstar